MDTVFSRFSAGGSNKISPGPRQTKQTNPFRCSSCKRTSRYMKKVLIIDDDAVTRGLLFRVLKPHSSYFQVLTSNNGKDAVSVIRKERVDLIITDLQMPEMDGFELMAYLSKFHPEIPILVMTAFGGTDIQAKIEAIGPIKYFEKPLNIDTLTDCIIEELESGAKGQIQGISLASFLQLVEMEEKTCTVTVKSDDKFGVVHLLKGDIMAAEAGDLENEDAVYELLCWNRVVLEIDNFCSKKTKEIGMPLMTLLMEGLKTKDEREYENQEKKKPLRPLKSFTK